MTARLFPRPTIDSASRRAANPVPPPETSWYRQGSPASLLPIGTAEDAAPFSVLLTYFSGGGL